MVLDMIHSNFSAEVVFRDPGIRLGKCEKVMRLEMCEKVNNAQNSQRVFVTIQMKIKV